jgi:PilZ domain
MILYRSTMSVSRVDTTADSALPARAPRLALSLPVGFIGDHNAGSGVTGDLSWGGCAVATPAQLSVGSYLQLQLTFAQGPIARVSVDLAVVRWSANGRFGVEFIKINPVDQERLRLLVLSGVRGSERGLSGMRSRKKRAGLRSSSAVRKGKGRRIAVEVPSSGAIQPMTVEREAHQSA